jgi:hypothetical protein
MKTVLLYALLLTGLSLVSCSDSEKETEPSIVNHTPPFKDYWFSIKFDLTPPEVTNMGFFNTWGGESTTDEYVYNTTGSTIPAKTVLNTQLSNNILTVTSTGVMPRQGSKIPDGYDGSESDWKEECNFEISVKANTATKTITSATLKLSNDFFSLDYDITSVMAFSEYNQAGLPEWSIHSTVEAYKEFDHFRIAISIDDVYGTAIKK